MCNNWSACVQPCAQQQSVQTATMPTTMKTDSSGLHMLFGNEPKVRVSTFIQLMFRLQYFFVIFVKKKCADRNFVLFLQNWYTVLVIYKFYLANLSEVLWYMKYVDFTTELMVYAFQNSLQYLTKKTRDKYVASTIILLNLWNAYTFVFMYMYMLKQLMPWW